MVTCDICNGGDDDGIELELQTPESPSTTIVVRRMCAGHAAKVLESVARRLLNHRLDQMIADTVMEMREAQAVMEAGHDIRRP